MLSTTVMIIILGAIATYLTRIGGHIILSRFERIHPRVDAALNAVPAAVLTTIVAPYAAFYGTAEAATLGIVALLSLRLPSLAIFAIGWICLLSLRGLLN